MTTEPTYNFTILTLQPNMTYVTDDYQNSVLFTIVFPFIWTLVIVLGSLGNGVVIVVALVYGQLRNTTNCYIFSLAVADISYLVICGSCTIHTFTVFSWKFGSIICRLYVYFAYVTIASACGTLVAMSVDRYIAVVHTHSKTCTRRPIQAHITSCCIWSFSLIINIPYFIHSGVGQDVSINATMKVCGLLWKDGSEDVRRYAPVVTIFIVYIIPLIVVIALYTKLVMYLRRLERSNNFADKSLQWKMMYKRRKVTCMVAIVTALFAVCWLPSHIVVFVMTFVPSHIYMNVSGYWVKSLGHTLALINSMINPIIYAFMNAGFRRSCCRLLCCKNCCFANKIGMNQHNHRPNIVTSTYQPRRTSLSVARLSANASKTSFQLNQSFRNFYRLLKPRPSAIANDNIQLSFDDDDGRMLSKRRMTNLNFDSQINMTLLEKNNHLSNNNNNNNHIKLNDNTRLTVGDNCPNSNKILTNHQTNGREFNSNNCRIFRTYSLRRQFPTPNKVIRAKELLKKQMSNNSLIISNSSDDDMVSDR
ncbi:hypothetical protein SNEBB_000217 [Seison nebaliae]|nr:hypothetical protein SNEBB_000217 [Seison nebaliae]